MANESDQLTNQLKMAADNVQECAKEETAFDDDDTEVMENTKPDFQQRGIQICGVQTQPTRPPTPVKHSVSTAA